MAHWHNFRNKVITDNIREASCKVIRKLYDNFKSEEFEKKVIEKNNEMRGSTNYLIRNNILLLIKVFPNKIRNS